MSFIVNFKKAMGLGRETVDPELMDDPEPQQLPAQGADPVAEAPVRVVGRDTLEREVADAVIELVRRHTVELAPDPSGNGAQALELGRLKTEASSLKTRCEELERRLVSADRQKRALSDRVTDLQDQVVALEDRNEKLTTASHPSPAPAKADNAEVGELHREVKRLKVVNDELQLKSKMSDKMLSDLTRKLATARKEAEDLKAAAENSGLDTATDQKVRRLERLIASKDRRIAELEKLDAETLQDRLRRLADDNAALTARADKLEREKADLNKTIETNLYNQAHSECSLRAQIKDLNRELLKLREEKPSKRRHGKGKSRPEGPGKDTPEADADPDFGYRAPARKPEQDPDIQLSMF